MEIIADFDTGAADTYADAAMLQNQGIIRITPTTPWRRESHLGQDFWFTIKRAEVALTGVDGSRHSTILNILCVRDWAQSPFVSINPNRKALVGRDLCLSLQPKITLDFSRHKTTIHW